jgi:hypothetical protein
MVGVVGVVLGSVRWFVYGAASSALRLLRRPVAARGHPAGFSDGASQAPGRAADVMSRRQEGCSVPRRNRNARKVHRGPSNTAYLDAKYGVASRRQRVRLKRVLRAAHEAGSL